LAPAPAPAPDSFVRWLENDLVDLSNRIKIVGNNLQKGAGAAIRNFSSGRQVNFVSPALGSETLLKIMLDILFKVAKCQLTEGSTIS
jgi:hypothetical protein